MVLIKSIAIVILTSSAALASGQAPNTKTAQPNEGGAPPVLCRVTLPKGDFHPKLSSSNHWYGTQFEGGVWYGTEKLWTVLPPDGIWHGSSPAEPHDFVYANKLPWGRTDPPFRRKDDPLTVTGKRLDGPAPRFTEIFESSGFGPDYSGQGIMGGIEIPASGCWQITGHYKDAELTFTVWVTRSQAESVFDQAFRLEPATPPQRVFVDREAQAKSLVYKVAPQIPSDVNRESVSGPVLLHAIISTNGRPRQLEFLSGPAGLAQAAIDAVNWWRYRVEMIGDEAVEVDTTIEVDFPQSKN